MAVSRSGTFYLERQRVFIPRRQRPSYMYKGSMSHKRPVYHLPELKGPDRPAKRVVTQLESQRVPYESTGHDSGCC